MSHPDRKYEPASGKPPPQIDLGKESFEAWRSERALPGHSFLGNLFSALGSKAWELDEHLTGGAIGDTRHSDLGRAFGAGVRGFVEQPYNIMRRMEAMQYIKDQGWLTDEAYATLEKVMSHPEGPLHSMINEAANRGVQDSIPGHTFDPDASLITGTFFGPGNIFLPQNLRAPLGEHPDVEGTGVKRSVEQLAHTIMHEFGHFLDQSMGSLDAPEEHLAALKQQLGYYFNMYPDSLSSKMIRAGGERRPKLDPDERDIRPYAKSSTREHLADRFAEAAKEASEDRKAGKRISKDLQKTILKRPDMREAFRNAIPGFDDWLWATGHVDAEEFLTDETDSIANMSSKDPNTGIFGGYESDTGRLMLSKLIELLGEEEARKLMSQLRPQPMIDLTEEAALGDDPRRHASPDWPYSARTFPESVTVKEYQEGVPGGTISGISEFFGITEEELIRANQIPDPNMINMGSTLKIPMPDEEEVPAQRMDKQQLIDDVMYEVAMQMALKKQWEEEARGQWAQRFGTPGMEASMMDPDFEDFSVSRASG